MIYAKLLKYNFTSQLLSLLWARESPPFFSPPPPFPPAHKYSIFTEFFTNIVLSHFFEKKS